MLFTVARDCTQRTFPPHKIKLTRKDNVQRRSLSDSPFFRQGSLVGLNEFQNEFFLGLGIHLGVALRNHVQGQRPVPVLDARCLRQVPQDPTDDGSPERRIALASNGLMQYCRANVIVHNHGCQRQSGNLLNAMEHIEPQVFAAELKHGVEFRAADGGGGGGCSKETHYVFLRKTWVTLVGTIDLCGDELDQPEMTVEQERNGTADQQRCVVCQEQQGRCDRWCAGQVIYRIPPRHKSPLGGIRIASDSHDSTIGSSVSRRNVGAGSRTIPFVEKQSTCFHAAVCPRCQWSWFYPHSFVRSSTADRRGTKQSTASLFGSSSHHSPAGVLRSTKHRPLCPKENKESVDGFLILRNCPA